MKKLWRWTFFRSGAGLFSCARRRDDAVTAEVLSFTSSWQLLLRVLRRALHALQRKTARVSCAVSRASCSSRVCSCHQQCVFYVSASVLLCRIRLILLGDHCLVRGGNSRDHTCHCLRSFTLQKALSAAKSLVLSPPFPPSSPVHPASRLSRPLLGPRLQSLMRPRHPPAPCTPPHADLLPLVHSPQVV